MAVYTAIDDPEAHFQAVTYTGNGSDDHAITFAGDTDMQPDLIWQKNIGDAVSHGVFDTLRGIGGGSNTKRLLPDNTNTEDDASNTVKSADSDGFTLGTNTNLNENNDSNVAWCWKANGSGSANTAGSIDTTATSANTTAGFSIVTWTGDENSSATLGHGLGAVPKFIITKGRTYGSSWATYHNYATADYWYQLCETDGKGDVNTIWNDTEPTSTLFTVGSSNQVNDNYTYVGYVWAEKQGYSKFGSYIGNGSANGPFIYTGFRPAWLMTKRSDSADNWQVQDNKRNPFNPVKSQLMPDSSDAENAGDAKCDFLSNGFKVRKTGASWNASAGKFIYAAFAESPFINSNGVPNNAR